MLNIDRDLCFCLVEWGTITGHRALEAKCVLAGQGCRALAQGTSFVDPTGKATEGTVTDLLSGTSYDCFLVSDQKLGKKGKCSKPIRITTLLQPTLVYKTSLSVINSTTTGRAITYDFSTDRCLVGAGGNFTDCMKSGMEDTVIYQGVVSPQKRWISFAGFRVSTGFRLRNMLTCPLGAVGDVDFKSCVISYAVPKGYAFTNVVYDPYGRRVWFAMGISRTRQSANENSLDSVSKSTANILLESIHDIRQSIGSKPTARSNATGYFGTCSINRQGVFSDCALSMPLPRPFLVGPGQDTNGFYGAKPITISEGLNLLYCQNDFSVPCSLVSGVPVDFSTFYLRFLTNTVVYLSGLDVARTNSFTYRCIVVNQTAFTNCQKIFEDSNGDLLLDAPANNGTQAYVFEANYTIQSANFNICDVDTNTAIIENCTVVSPSSTVLLNNLAFSSPIAF